MRITTSLLKKHKACEKQIECFVKAYPDGIEASGENAVLLSAEGFDVMWAFTLLPPEGPGSQRAFALWCAEQVAHLNNDSRVKQCLEVVRREVLQPGSQNLKAAHNAALTARNAARGDARTAAWAAAMSTYIDAWGAVLDTAWVAAGEISCEAYIIAREAQIFMLGEMLREL